MSKALKSKRRPKETTVEQEDASVEKMADDSSVLTPSTMKELPITTMCTKISELRAEFLAELRSSVVSLQAIIATQVQHLQVVETLLSDVEGRLIAMESQISSVTAENKAFK
ncbi:hypothetical protein AAFF_G00384080 [Aldrovandia affinis]|uniref:Uncharacterized protein n=1 Tax=Aldrovandia affinis TaxID=143900 RepID=A0AAD7WMI1_9TELE|nr:hypothetical protein AAFF_G00384080 [Aldrovandia affinis]